MRAKVKLEIQDEEGNVLSQFDPYWMELGSQSLHDIEGAVENWKQKVLPEIEADLLTQAQGLCCKNFVRAKLSYQSAFARATTAKITPLLSLSGYN